MGKSISLITDHFEPVKKVLGTTVKSKSFDLT